MLLESPSFEFHSCKYFQRLLEIHHEWKNPSEQKFHLPLQGLKIFKTEVHSRKVETSTYQLFYVLQNWDTGSGISLLVAHSPLVLEYAMVLLTDNVMDPEYCCKGLQVALQILHEFCTGYARMFECCTPFCN